MSENELLKKQLREEGFNVCDSPEGMASAMDAQTQQVCDENNRSPIKFPCPWCGGRIDGMRSMSSGDLIPPEPERMKCLECDAWFTVPKWVWQGKKPEECLCCERCGRQVERLEHNICRMRVCDDCYNLIYRVTRNYFGELTGQKFV